jgi:hypothetical protein
MLINISKLPNSLEKLLSVAVWNEWRRAWPFELGTILRSTVPVLQLLEVKIYSFKEIKGLLDLLSNYPRLRALTLVYLPPFEDDFGDYLPSPVDLYPYLCKLTVTAPPTEFHSLLRQFPKFSSLDALRCIIHENPDLYEENAINQVMSSAHEFYERGSKYKRLSIISLYTIEKNTCGRISSLLYTRYFPMILSKLEHLYIASGAHLHIPSAILSHIAARSKRLVSFHLISLPTLDPSKYANQISSRLSPANIVPSQLVCKTLPRCQLSHTATLSQFLKFASQLKHLQHVSLIINATVLEGIGNMRAPAMQTLHVGTSPIEGILRESIGILIKTCFQNIRSISHSFGDYSDLASKEQASTWDWVINFAVNHKEPSIPEPFIPEARYHEVPAMQVE